MALILKNSNLAFPVGAIPNGQAYVSQWIHVARPTLALPQTATQQIFRVRTGRVLVKLLVGEVTTVIEGTDPVLKVSVSKLTAANLLSGTAYDIASTLDISSDEVGTMYSVEGDGTAIISGGQVAGSVEAFSTGFVVAGPGQIYITTGASKTGAIKWDCWYQPLDESAYVEAIVTATAAIT